MELRDVYLRDNRRCVYCGFGDGSFEQHVQLTIDHIIPGRPGRPKSEKEDNFAIACYACNLAKGGFDPSEGSLDTPGQRREEMINRAKTQVLRRRAEWRSIYDRQYSKSN